NEDGQPVRHANEMTWLLGIALLLLADFSLESGLLAYATYVLLGLLFLSRFLARSWIGNLSAARTCDRLTADIGERVEVTVAVRNGGRVGGPGGWLEGGVAGG